MAVVNFFLQDARRKLPRWVQFFSSVSKSPKLIRLSKRMSELDMCSRREADRYISNQQVLVCGIPAMLGQKVPANETDIEIEPSTFQDNHMPPAAVLNKPIGYVSGQPEDDNVPAVRLLTACNISDEFKVMDFSKWGLRDDTDTLSGFAPAGRLDKESNGLLVFSRSGVLSKKLVSAEGLIEKEYIVEVEPAKRPSMQERRSGLLELPKPLLNLSALQRGGSRLWNEARPLRSVDVVWIEKGKILKFILKEGRKRQIRRMCRELLGFHVLKLERTRIGPIKLNGLPTGCWRPLREDEVNIILDQKAPSEENIKQDLKPAPNRREAKRVAREKFKDGLS